MVGLIIFGRRSRTSVVAQGDFSCPSCQSGRPYRHVVVKRWFTLYFIPVIPLGKTGEYVECTVCAKKFTIEALRLALPPAQVVQRK